MSQRSCSLFISCRASFTRVLRCAALALVIALCGVTSLSTASAQAPAVDTATTAGQRPSLGEVLSRMMPMFVIVFFIFYFMVIKPQQAKLKTQRLLVEGLKKGDSVVTTGGLIGKVVSVEPQHVVLEIAANVKVRVERSHIERREDAAPAAKTAA
jgi:preprotein translocase subunit YajC